MMMGEFFFLYFSQHQQQVAAAVERAKQVTMTELNQIIGVGKMSSKETHDMLPVLPKP